MLRVLRWFAVALGVVLVVALGVGWWISEPGHEGPVSDHFDGSTFRNVEGTALPSARRALRMMWERDPGPWAWRDIEPRPAPPERVSAGLRATFVNHATVLLQLDGVNVLTDPIWSERCSAVQWAGPARHHLPGVAFKDLPPIDVVLISHNHYDHLDVGTLAALQARDAPTVVVGLGVGAQLRRLGMTDVVEIDWDQSAYIGELEIIGQRTRHFGGRGLFDRNTQLWLGFVIVAPSAKIYFGGDTGYGDHFARTGAEHGPFDLALIPIGAYAPRWFMGPVHVDPVDAVRAHQDLRAERSMGIHFGTFRLTEEGMYDPPRELAAARAEAGLPEESFVALVPGQALEVMTAASANP